MFSELAKARKYVPWEPPSPDTLRQGKKYVVTRKETGEVMEELD